MSGQILKAEADISLTEQLLKLLRRPVNGQDRARACLHVLDWLGCAIAAYKSPPAKALRAHLEGAAPGPCRALGLVHTDPQSALLLNGALGSILDIDDLHRAAGLRPGSIVIPAALAAAQAHGASAQDFLDGVVVGYEAMIRVGRSLGPSHQRYFHASSTSGTFGAAGAAGAIIGLDDEQMLSALGNAGSQSGGFSQIHQEAVMTTCLHSARAAGFGVLAAELAANGFTGPRNILEGPGGLYVATSPDADPAVVADDIYEPWMLFDTSFRIWPTCHHVHAAIDATLEVREQAADVSLVDEVTVGTYTEAVQQCNREQPATTGQARFSLQHAVAVTLLRGGPRLQDFVAATIRDSRLAALRSRVRPVTDNLYDDAYPEHCGAEVEVKLRDGRTYSFAVQDPKGGPENPLSKRAIADKACQMMRVSGMDEERIAALRDATLALDKTETLDEFAATLP